MIKSDGMREDQEVDTAGQAPGTLWDAERLIYQVLTKLCPELSSPIRGTLAMHILMTLHNEGFV
jgi:hypothetical protein